MIGDIIEIERARLGTVVPASGAPASNDAGKAHSSAPSGNGPAPPAEGEGMFTAGWLRRLMRFVEAPPTSP